ncbi:MAG: DNA repair protein RecO [Chitinivibrionales bacterium]|nr:DNA repair protein RecO [Chitinivibrionales bacterium]
MAVRKTDALILKVLPYRESSCLVYLFTKQHGLVNGIAKGVKRKKSGSPPVERGMRAELIVYSKPQRELHTIAGIQTLDMYEGIRAGLEKSALRDAAFEMVLKTMKHSEPHADLFDFFDRFLSGISGTPLCSCFPRALWRFYIDYARILGFGANFFNCAGCGKPLDTIAGGYLIHEKGGCLCEQCLPQKPAASYLPGAVLEHIRSQPDRAGPASVSFPVNTVQRITRLLASYCAYHCDIRPDFNSLDFLDDLLKGQCSSFYREGMIHQAFGAREC